MIAWHHLALPQGFGGQPFFSGSANLNVMVVAPSQLAVIPRGRVRLLDPGLILDADRFGTVRGRLGFAFDRLLVFGSGGFAYGGGESGGRNSTDDVHVGWAAGGIEYAVTNNVTVKAEGLYIDFEEKRARSYAYARDAAGNLYFGPTRVFSGGDNDFVVGRAGLNYKF